MIKLLVSGLGIRYLLLVPIKQQQQANEMPDPVTCVLDLFMCVLDLFMCVLDLFMCVYICACTQSMHIYV